MEQNNSLHKKIGMALGAAVIAGVAGVTFAYEMMASKAASSATADSVAPTSGTPPTSDSSQSSNATGSVPPAIVQKTSTVASSAYKDGTYSATGSYMSPGGEEQIKVTLTLANDVITDATVTSLAYDRTSQRYQKMFISGYKQYVIGKDISAVNLTYVSGSSLTPAGFDSALQNIESQAKA